MIPLIFRDPLFYPGNHHAPDESWNIFQHRKLIQLKVRSCSEICLELACPCARRDLGSLGKSEDQDGDFACGGIGQYNLVAGKALPFDLRHLRNLCAIDEARNMRQQSKRTQRRGMPPNICMKISPIR